MLNEVFGVRTIKNNVTEKGEREPMKCDDASGIFLGVKKLSWQEQSDIKITQNKSIAQNLHVCNII